MSNAEDVESTTAATGTTHNGGGRPRLIPVLGGNTLIADPKGPFTVQVQEIDLVSPVTVLGSGPQADVRLDALDALHARIDHDDRDEWVLHNLTDPERTKVNGEAMGDKALHTGDRVDLGPLTFSYFRDEDADHGRPFGGRQGGELSVQQPQPSREAQHPTSDDPD